MLPQMINEFFGQMVVDRHVMLLLVGTDSSIGQRTGEAIDVTLVEACNLHAFLDHHYILSGGRGGASIIHRHLTFIYSRKLV